MIRVPFWVRFLVRVPCYICDLSRRPHVETYPCRGFSKYIALHDLSTGVLQVVGRFSSLCITVLTLFMELRPKPSHPNLEAQTLRIQDPRTPNLLELKLWKRRKTRFPWSVLGF